MTGSDPNLPAGAVVLSLIGIAAVAIQVLFAWMLRVWGRRVAERQGGVWWRRAAWMPILGLGAAALGMAWTVISLMQAFEAVSKMEPSQKAAALEQAISQAMIPTVVLLPVSWALYTASLVVFAVGASSQPTHSQG